MKRSKTRTEAGRQIAPIHALLGAAILGLLVMPVAFAGASSPQAQTSASTRAQLKSLKHRVSALETRSAPAAPTTLPPTGPAGGILEGSYPDPSGLTVGSVGAPEILDGSVGAADLKATYERVSEGTHLAANTFGDATASCNAGDHVLGGGYAWQNDAGADQRNNANNNVTSSDTTSSTPNISGGGFGDNPDQWVARARSNVENTLFAWAVCLRA